MVFALAGDKEKGHTHQFDHLTLLAAGTLQITVEGAATVFKAPHMIYIHKDKNHELLAMEDNTVAYCIHALRKEDGSGDILDPSMIPNGAQTDSVNIDRDKSTAIISARIKQLEPA